MPQQETDRLLFQITPGSVRAATLTMLERQGDSCGSVVLLYHLVEHLTRELAGEERVADEELYDAVRKRVIALAQESNTLTFLGQR